MSKFNFVKRCYNCGAVLQSEDPKEPGYIDQSLLEKGDNGVLFCQKCFQQEHFNISPKSPSASQDYLTMMEDAQASDALIVYVIDLFSFECSFIPEVVEIIRGLPIVVVANKRDLLPLSTPDEDLKEYVAHRFRLAKLDVHKEDVFLASLGTSTDIKEIIKVCREKRQAHDIYVIGATKAGKTLLISSFLRSYANKSKRQITTSYYPGTQLMTMMIPMDNSSSIIDTPGTSLENSLLGHLDEETAKAVIPSSRVKARNFTLAEGDGIAFGAVAGIVLTKGEKTLVRVYASKEVNLAKIGKSKGYEVYLAKALVRTNAVPSSKNLEDLTDFDIYEVEVEEMGLRDIGIEGLGWINIRGKNQTFRLIVPKGVSVYATRAKVLPEPAPTIKSTANKLLAKAKQAYSKAKEKSAAKQSNKAKKKSGKKVK